MHIIGIFHGYGFRAFQGNLSGVPQDAHVTPTGFPETTQGFTVVAPWVWPHD